MAGRPRDHARADDGNRGVKEMRQLIGIMVLVLVLRFAVAALALAAGVPWWAV